MKHRVPQICLCYPAAALLVDAGPSIVSCHHLKRCYAIELVLVGTIADHLEHVILNRQEPVPNSMCAQTEWCIDFDPCELAKRHSTFMREHLAFVQQLNKFEVLLQTKVFT